MSVTRATILTGPTQEPITLAEAKKQCELSPSDTAHDDHLRELITAAREQWEHDTDSCCLAQTLYVHTDEFDDEICLPKRPITSITSIQYYDLTNTLQTLASSVYSLNPTERELEIAYLQVWPPTIDRWDAVKITYVAGYATPADVPSIHKSAIKLLIGHYFENRDMMMSEALQSMKAYESLVMRYMRSCYP